VAACSPQGKTSFWHTLNHKRPYHKTGVTGNLCQLGGDFHVDPFFCNRCQSSICDGFAQTCDCDDGWTGNFCDIEIIETNSTEANATYFVNATDTDYVQGNLTKSLANNTELRGQDTPLIIVESMCPEGWTGELCEIEGNGTNWTKVNGTDNVAGNGTSSL
jgi:hypothetical protein